MAERETIITSDHEDTGPFIEHAVRYRYPLDCATRMAGADVTDVRATRREADRMADWHRRNGATVEILTRTWTPSDWRPVPCCDLHTETCRPDDQCCQACPGPTPPFASPTRRLRACVEVWPDCHAGGYDPSCCRFPKSCSATVYDPRRVTDDDLEPA